MTNVLALQKLNIVGNLDDNVVAPAASWTSATCGGV